MTLQKPQSQKVAKPFTIKAPHRPIPPLPLSTVAAGRVWGKLLPSASSGQGHCSARGKFPLVVSDPGGPSATGQEGS